MELLLISAEEFKPGNGRGRRPCLGAPGQTFEKRSVCVNFTPVTHGVSVVF